MDIKRKLRELEPFYAAEGALKEIDNLLRTSSNIQKKNLTLELLSEFVFFEKPNQNIIVSKYDELLILQTICKYFSTKTNAGRHELFAIMFNKDILKNQKQFLYKLIAMSILLRVDDIVHATGTFMNQLGNLSTESLGICEMLINELFVNYPACHEYLVPLTNLSTVFTANFITGVCNIYLNRETNEFKVPSRKLLVIITEWLINDLSVCFANKDLLKNSKNAKNELPVIGLMRWVILAPLFQLNLRNEKRRKGRETFKDALAKGLGVLEAASEAAAEEERSNLKKNGEPLSDCDGYDSFIEREAEGKHLVLVTDVSPLNGSLFLNLHLHLLQSIELLHPDLIETNSAPIRINVNVFVPFIKDMLFLVETENVNAFQYELITSYIRLTQIIVQLKQKKILEGDLHLLTPHLNQLPQNLYLTSLFEQF